MPEPPQLTPLNAEEQRLYSSWVTELLIPATLRRKPILATRIILSVTEAHDHRTDRYSDHITADAAPFHLSILRFPLLVNKIPEFLHILLIIIYLRDDLELELENAAHWIKFAAAVYGLPKYICSFLFSRPCHLFDDYRNYDVGGDALGCQFASIRKTTGLQSRDFIRVSFHDQVYEVPFFVALDHERKAVVVAIRGTQSLEDVLTDLSFECEDLPIEGVTGACYAHKGMCKTARYICNKLVNDDDGILYQAFSKVPEYKLVITGHSLGAGTASIVALLLRKSYPTLQCYSFSPPGGLLSKALAEYSKDFVTSVVLGKDVVPRLSLPNMEDLKKQIFHTVYNCNKPKYRILLQGLWYELFGGYPGDSPTEMEHNREGALLMYESLESENWLVRTAPDVPLFLPGRILYITEDGPPHRCCSSQVKYRADWSSEMNFKTILISPRMIGDHMTNSVMGALNSLIGETPSPPL